MHKYIAHTCIRKYGGKFCTPRGSKRGTSHLGICSIAQNNIDNSALQSEA